MYRILYQKQKKDYLLAISTIGLLLTHTVITLYAAIFSAIYVAIYYKKIKNKEILKAFVWNLLLAILITSFFWMPLLEIKNSADYEVFKPGRMERTEVLIAYKLDITDLLYTSPDSGMIYEIGFITIIGLALSPLAIKKMRKHKEETESIYQTYLFMLIAGMVCIIMTLKIFPFEHLPSMLKMIQFTFRLLEFSSFFFAVVAAINFGILINEFGKKELVLLVSMLMLLTCMFTTHLRYLEEFHEEVLWPAVPVTEQVGRVHAGLASFEYLPCKAFENRSYIETRDQSVKIIEGNCQIENTEKDNTNLSFDVQYVVESTKLELPYIYYPGYEVVYQAENGTKQTLKTFETENGFVGIEVPISQNAHITVSYTGTTIMKLSSMLSLTGLCILIGAKIKNSQNIK